MQTALVEWSGVVWRCTPTADAAAVGQAVERVLGDAGFRTAAARLQQGLEESEGAPRAAAVMAGMARRTIVPDPRSEALPSHAG